MPWKTGDVDKFKKGLSDGDKGKWIAIANAALSQCTAEGGELILCEQNAIRIANAKFSDDQTIHETTYMHDVETIGDIQKETMMRFALQPVEPNDAFQMVIPVGVFHDDWYGEIIITNSFTEAMVVNWEAQVLGNRQPFIDTNHRGGQANGWIELLESRDDGLYAKIKWTKLGVENIQEEYYKYYSAELGRTMLIDTGETAWPVLFAVTLCNNPVMNSMAPAHLSQGNPPAHRDGSTHILGGVHNEDPSGNHSDVARGKYRRKGKTYRRRP